MFKNDHHSLYIREDIIPILGKNADFDAIMQMNGKLYRDLCNRRTFSIEIEERQYFVKAHLGVGWGEIFKNLSQLKQPIISAENEWRAIDKLHQLKVPTMQLAAYGKRGRNPAKMQSFVMTDALLNTESLEDFCPRYFTPPLCAHKLRLKRAIIDKIAWTARELHQNKLIHCDLYICHFLLDLSRGEENLQADDLLLYLIDLHRVRFAPVNLQRWIIKDLAAIYFSAMSYMPVDKTDLLRFIRSYRQESADQVLRKEHKFWQKVQQRAFRTYRKFHGHEPPLTQSLV